MATVKIDSELKKVMQSSIRFYDDADVKWFDILADDVTIYAIGKTEPIVGRKAFEQNWRSAFQATKRKTKFMHQDVKVLGSTAVVTQTLEIIQSGILSNVRQSVVWAKTDNKWQIKHLHSALIGQPSSTKRARSAGDIQVLNERIATVAAVLGVAQ